MLSAVEMSGAPSSVRGPAEHLLGRQREREVLDRLLEAARRGDGRALVVHGEPGVGKTALLDYTVEAGPEAITLDVLIKDPEYWGG